MLQHFKLMSLVGLLLLAAACDLEIESSDSQSSDLEVQNIIQRKCGSCHNGSAVQNQAQREGDKEGTTEVAKNSASVSSFIANGSQDQLVFSGYVIPGKPKESPIYEWLTNHGQDSKVPLKTRLAQRRKDWLNDVEKEKIISWIQKGAGGYYINDIGEFKLAQAISLINDDYEKLPADKQPGVRYLYFTPYLNYPVKKDVMDGIQNAVNIAVNSISSAKNLAIPEFFGPGKLIVRLDINDYKWEKRHWEQLVRDYPYASALIRNDQSGVLAKIDAKTTSKHTIIRGDWFLHHAVAEANYYRFLDIPQNLNEFEKFIGVDFIKQYQGTQFIRAGFAKSGVANHNRVIERHPREDGFVWRSFEFATSNGTNNVLEFPFGPNENRTAAASTNADDNTDSSAPDAQNAALLAEEKTHSFTPQGSEFIFNLPNGMLGYYILQGENALQSAPAAGGLPAVRVGLSCMRCHEGLIVRKDEVRDSFKKDISAELRQKLMAIYVTQDKFNEKIAKDGADFRKVLAEMSIKIDGQQPVVTISDRFENGSLSPQQILAELGLDPLEHKTRNQMFLTPGTFQTTFSRANFENTFDGLQDAVRARISGKNTGGGTIDPNQVPAAGDK